MTIGVAGVRGQLSERPRPAGGRYRTNISIEILPVKFKNSNFFGLWPKPKIIRGTLTSQRPLRNRGPFYPVQIRSDRERGGHQLAWVWALASRGVIPAGPQLGTPVLVPLTTGIAATYQRQSSSYCRIGKLCRSGSAARANHRLM